MHHVRGSESTNTGVAPAYMTACAQEMIVKVALSHSWRGLRSSASRASCRATVPLLTATPWFLPQYSAHPSSTSVMTLPDEETHPVRTHSETNSSSCGLRCGSLTGIIRTVPFHPVRYTGPV